MKSELNIRKFIKNNIVQLLEQSHLLNELSNKEKLVQKLDIPESQAEYLSNRMGKLAVWFVNAVIKNWKEQNIEIINNIKKYPNFFQDNYDDEITKILDWIRHPLNAGRINLKDLTLQKAIEASRKFHEELQSMGGDIDYVEKNPIIINYDNGMYWAQLPASYSEEECKRMGHCGRTNKGTTLFSLRSNIPYGKDHTYNDSHITVAYNENSGIVYQSKGKLNSKPNEKYQPYIFDLFLKLKNFKGIGTEYKSDSDYSWNDMSKNQIDLLYKIHPDAFKTYKAQKILVDFGILDKITIKDIIEVHWSVEDIESYIQIPRDIRKDIIKAILVDPWAFFDYYDSSSWKYTVDDISKENNEIFLNFLKNKLKKIMINFEIESVEDFLEVSAEVIDDPDLEDQYDIDLIDQISENLRQSINRACADAEQDSYINYYQTQLKKALSFYGEVESLDDTGATIFLEVERLIKDIDPKYSEYVDQYYENCDNDILCVFNECIGGGEIETPRLMIDDRYTPSINYRYFNEILHDLFLEEFT